MKNRRVLFVVSVVLFVLFAVWLKVRLEAGKSYEQAKALDEDGEVELAIICYRRTVRWYSPGSEPVSLAVERLWVLGQTLESDGKAGDALLAYRALRSALFGVRSFFQPYEERIDPVEDRIAFLMAGQRARPSDTSTFQAIEQKYRAQLDRDLAPNTWWSLLAVLSFVLWCLSLFGLAWHGFDEETGKIRRRSFGRWGGAVLVTLAAWMVGLVMA